MIVIVNIFSFMTKISKADSGHYQISEMEHFAKIINSFTQLIILAKQFILDILRGFEYTSESIPCCKNSLEIFQSIQTFIKV